MGATESLEQRAAALAELAHRGQTRKGTADPYIVHPLAVAEIVRGAAHDEAMIAAALLHDVVEDTGIPIDKIRDEFGEDVAELVSWLTDVSRPEDGNRAARKAKDRAHSAAAPARAQTVKLADLIDNAQTIVECDPEFAVTYIEEKALLLGVLTKGDPGLQRRAAEIVLTARAKLARLGGRR